MGVIGCGGRGSFLAEHMPAEGRVVALCDCYDAQVEAAQRKSKNASWATYQDYRKMIDTENLDAVIVATTDQNRVLACVLACQAGLDIYAEKPLTLTVAEGQTLIRAVRKHNRVCQVGTHQRLMEPNRFAANLIRNGAIGKVHTVLARQYKPPKRYAGLPTEAIPDGLDWDLWSGPAPLHPYNHWLHLKMDRYQGWAQWRDYSGGDVTLHGAHAADQIQNALGKDHTGPVEIWPISDKPDAQVRMRYADGTVIRFERDFGVWWGAVFVGEDGKIEINRGRIASNPPDLIKDAPKTSGGDASPHMRDWLECIKTRKKPIADVQTGHHAVNLCHLINVCRETGRKLHWDPQKETFSDDEEANSLMDRPRRKGFELA
ncbi:Gfo/Idh/MocA family protein [Bacillus paralicheniformis]|uniref:Gfo/Idh/MocA family protein n=1 Tax=Bacillus paralicheniformis TaxID=1648923 RepID=UPI0015DF45AE